MRTTSQTKDVMKHLSVVLPAHNEEDAVGLVVAEIKAQAAAIATLGYDLEILVCANACTDATERVALEAGARVVAEPRKGYGRALKTGMIMATGDAIVCMDADLTYPPEAIPRMLALLAEHPFVTTDRLADRGAMSVSHHLVNQVFSGVAWLRGSKIRDTQSGMWAFRRELLADLLNLGDGMELSQTLKLRLERQHRDLIQVPIVLRPRVGEMKLRPVRDAIRVMVSLLTGR